ncbi:MAG: hypothetical protein SO067_06000 [Bacilli bacterium]|nr:hypothetical protein [Bacilli bacterium]
MKHFLKFICLIVTFFMLTTGVLALTVSENNIEIPKSDRKSIELSTNSEEMLTSVEFTLIYTTYDIPASFIVNPNYTDSNPNGIKHKIIFSEPINGNIILGNININVVDDPKDNAGTVNIHSAIGYTESGETINLTSQNINVTVLNNRETNTETNEIEKPKEDKHEETKEFDKNVLKEIKSDLVKINIQKDIFEYTITINNDIEKLDLEPIAINESYKVEISNQEIATLEDNKINITITDDKGNKIDYIIKVNILKDISDVEIDNTNYKEKNTYKGKWIILVIIFSTILLFGLILTRKKK